MDFIKSKFVDLCIQVIESLVSVTFELNPRPNSPQISLIVPNEKNKEFSGNIRIVNMDNISDYEIIPVSLNTPKNRILYPFFLFWNRFIERFPILDIILNVG